MKNIVEKIWRVLEKNEKRRFNLLIILDIIISVIDILSLALLLWIIQFYIQPGNKYSLAFLPPWLTNKGSVTFIAVFVFLFAIKNWCGFLVSRAQFTFISQVAVRVSKRSLFNYQHSPFEEFINTDSSAHIRRICFQPFEFSQYMLSGIQQIITQFSLILLTIIAILLFNAKLFLLLLLILLPPVILVFYFIKKKLSEAKKHIQSSNERSIQYLLDALKGYVESNIYQRNDFFLRRFAKFREKFSMHLFESLALQNMPNRIIEVFAVLGLFILIAIAKWNGNNDTTTLITIGAFMAAAYKIIPGIVKLINLTSQIKAYEFAINEGVENTRRSDKPVEGIVEPAITSFELKNIDFQYPAANILRDFSLSIEKGDFIGITGESGKGKTTILNVLLGFITPSNGEIIINGHSIESENIKVYWPAIAYVRQQGFFIHDTVLRNITMEEEGCNKKNLDYALNASGLDKMLLKFPEGIDKIITENGKNLSGGQQQRIAIARLLYKNATLLLLDEPFNELDEESTTSLIEQFRSLSASGKTIVMITHDKKSLTYCNKIIAI